jgi:hypothetical protein
MSGQPIGAEAGAQAAFARSWSGGKDSALTLSWLRGGRGEPAALITTVTEGYDRVSIHGVRRELVARQAEALGIPLVEVVIPRSCANETYDARMAAAFAVPPLSAVGEVAFGDLFLEDVRAYREERLASAGKAAFSRCGDETLSASRATSWRPASKQRSCALTLASSIGLSPAGATTSRCSQSCRRMSTPAVRTASSTPSSPRVLSSLLRLRATGARSSSGTDSSSAT